ncbi:unnamed protein product [Staurois parvus]|uniref:Uncharacterized protein n=1 Tax=Staurois parvus TaxID=386267 RepID=A0ABN9G7I6_9NEOB|nr:unnamed protein product [Staurois parvus]
MQPHHLHREMWTSGRVPLILMARHPHWKTQPYWEPRFQCRMRFQKKCRDFFPCMSWAQESIKMNGLSCPYKTRPAQM